MRAQSARGFARPSLRWWSVLVLLAAGTPAVPLVAQVGDSSAQRTSTTTSAASPRASVQRYLELARAARFDEAARYLDLPDSLANDGPELARQLKAVLDRYVWLDLEEISPASTGDTTDGLTPRVDQIGEIPGPAGTREPVRLSQVTIDDVTLWRFTRATVRRTPVWYEGLEGRWITEHLPPFMLRPGPFDLLWWQWAALPIVIVLAAGLGAIASRILRAILGRVASRTVTEWDDLVLMRIGAPLTLAFTLLGVGLLSRGLGLYAPAAATVHQVVRGGLLLVVFWTLWRLTALAGRIVGGTEWARNTPTSRALIPLGTRALKSIIIAVGLVATFSFFGYPVASLIAGLGLGGLAFALAAQKTVENLFGAFSIGFDQPFREDDFVKIEDFVGTVERIGLRSTRFRTLDRTIITIPNGRLADMRLESFTVRDRLRLATVIGLVRETTTAQMRQVLEGFERVLRAHPKIWPDAVVVRFREFATSSLDIEIMAWFQTADWGEFQLIRQEILLEFMQVVEQARTSIAVPTRTLHVASLPRGAELVRAQ